MPSDRAFQRTQKEIFESSFMALHGVTYVTFPLYPIKIDITEQIISFIIFFIANLSVSLQLSNRSFIGLYGTLNIILMSCIVGQILVGYKVPPVKYNTSKSPFSLSETKSVLK